MQNHERIKIIWRGFLRAKVRLMFSAAIAFIFYDKFVLAGILLFAAGVLDILLYGLTYISFWILCNIGVLLLGCGYKALGTVLLALAVVIAAVDIIMLFKAVIIGKGELKRLMAAGKSPQATWLDLKRENEITCILWNKLKTKVTHETKAATLVQDMTQDRTMTNSERKKVIKLALTALTLVALLVSSIVCILCEKIVWAGVLFVAAGVLNIFYMGLPFTILIIIVGLSIVSFGYEKRVMGLMLLIPGFVIVTANTILGYKSILDGRLEKLSTLSKTNRFVFFEYFREIDITCILTNKLKHRLSRTETGKNH